MYMQVSLLEAVMKLLLTSLKKNSKKFGLHRHVCWDNPTDAEVSVPNQQDLEQEGGMELESDQRAPGLELGHVLDESLNVESGLEDSDGVGEAVLLTQECTVALVSLLKHYRHLQNSQGNQKKANIYIHLPHVFVRAIYVGNLCSHPTFMHTLIHTPTYVNT